MIKIEKKEDEFLYIIKDFFYPEIIINTQVFDKEIVEKMIKDIEEMLDESN